MNTKLYEHIKNNEEILVSGLEGSGKSRDVIEVLLNGNIIDFEKEIVVYGMQSFESLGEKQERLMKYYGLTIDECPILSVSGVVEEKNKKFVQEVKRKYEPCAKVIFMSLSALKKNHHTLVTCNGKYKKIRAMVIDEFDFTSNIIPRLDYLIVNLLNSSKSKKTVLNYIKEEWTRMDAILYEDMIRSGKNSYLVANYIDRNKDWNCKTIFISSEEIPRLILEDGMGFNSINLDGGKTFNHTIHYCSDVVNRHTFNRLNNENKWNIFGFETIISDRYGKDTELDHLEITNHSKLDAIEVTNHSNCRGSNKFKGNNKLLSIISHVPDSVVANICDALNEFTDKHINEAGETVQEYSFEKIKSIYYKDRLLQAVGRVIGYRGESDYVDETWVLISKTIMDLIIERKIPMPYKLEKWDMENEIWDELKQAVLKDGRIELDKKDSITSKTNLNNKNKARAVIDRYIDRDNSSFVSCAEIKELLKKHEVFGVVPKFVANHFGLEMGQKWKNGRVHRCIHGIKIKE
jgi:hypothetical protein